MKTEHPITPPPELVDKLASGPGFWTERLVRAFQAGADQELEACCADVQMGLGPNEADWLRSVRRPKPLSLKEQSIALIDKIQGNKEMWDIRDLDVIRRALDSSPE